MTHYDIVVLHPVAEWVVDDGVRSLEDPIKYNEVLLATLRELELSFIEIGGEMRDLQQRVLFVKQALGSTVSDDHKVDTEEKCRDSSEIAHQNLAVTTGPSLKIR